MDSFTQIALGIAIAEVCAGKKLKNKTILYGSILARFRCCCWSLLDPVNAVLIHRGISHSLFLFLFYPLFWLDYFKTGKKKVDFLHFYGFGVCLPMYY
jgi:inner membrane protein